MAKFKVVYWERIKVCTEWEIVAETDDEARQKMREGIADNEIDASYAKLIDSGFDVEKIVD